MKIKNYKRHNVWQSKTKHDVSQKYKAWGYTTRKDDTWQSKIKQYDISFRFTSSCFVSSFLVSSIWSWFGSIISSVFLVKRCSLYCFVLTKYDWMREDITREEIRRDETRRDETRRDETRRDETRRDETRRDETRRDETRRDETRRDETRRDETRRDETRRDETRRDETRRDETRRDETRRDETRRDQTKPDQTKPDQTKPDQTKPDEIRWNEIFWKVTRDDEKTIWEKISPHETRQAMAKRYDKRLYNVSVDEMRQE